MSDTTAEGLTEAEREAVRAEVVAALMQPVHAPLGDHDPRDGSCQSCPWPLHMVESPEGIADAVLPILADRLAAAQAERDHAAEAKNQSVRCATLREAARIIDGDARDIVEQRVRRELATYLRSVADTSGPHHTSCPAIREGVCLCPELATQPTVEAERDAARAELEALRERVGALADTWLGSVQRDGYDCAMALRAALDAER